MDAIYGDECRNVEEIDALASNLEGKAVVSLDDINWTDAGKSLELAVLMRLSSGRAIQKKPMEDVLGNVWRISDPAIFLKVDRNTLLIIFKTKKDQTKVLTGGRGHLKVT